MGDGGSGGDPENRAQNPAELLGKLLRIDVESGFLPYVIPATNPFAQTAVFGVKSGRWACETPGDLPSIGRTATSISPMWARIATKRWTISRPRVVAGRTMAGESWKASTATIPQTAARPGSLCLLSNTVMRKVARSRGARLQGKSIRPDAGRLFLCRLLQRQDLGTASQCRILGSPLLLDAPFTIATFGEDESGEVYVADYSGGLIYRIVDQL